MIDEFTVKLDLSNVRRASTLHQIIAELMDHPIEGCRGDMQPVADAMLGKRLDLPVVERTIGEQGEGNDSRHGFSAVGGVVTHLFLLDWLIRLASAEWLRTTQLWVLGATKSNKI
ncbi:MAG: hypothetical protein AW07_00855 [Candidatus Accumulibacter sp. SK-11]|nr:MAG: hypothetical protein AW07_00855 [Candidatus Accumulibacter sp. SK-11]